MNRERNFTGADLTSAENYMQIAWNTYQNAVNAYNIPASVDSGSYESRSRESVMNATKSQYDIAKSRYDDILKGYTDASNANFQTTQQTFVADALTGNATQATPPANNYTTIIYVVIALALGYFIFKK